ncbi:MAG TPA: hypothetical protein VHT74_22300, partial [Acetobacteraceae bacterium]|nr:hypothetical protein [Acetobacteraceae bacterium]
VAWQQNSEGKKMSWKSSIIDCLINEEAIPTINFDFNGIKIWPGAYKDVANALSRGDILLTITGALPAGAGAAYNAETDELKVPPDFNINIPDSLSDRKNPWQGDAKRFC